MRIQTNDGATFTGPDAKAVVRQMRDQQWSAPVMKRDYMVEVAERVEMLTGERIATTPAETFLNELERVGLVTIEPSDGENVERVANEA